MRSPGFAQGSHFGPADENHARECLVGQSLERPLVDRALLVEAGERTEAGGSRGIRLKEPCPRLGQGEQPQRVSGRAVSKTT